MFRNLILRERVCECSIEGDTMRKIYFAAAFLALVTMSAAPLAQGKEAEVRAQARAREMLQDLGFTGLDRAKNMGEIWDRARETLPPETLQKYDRAVSLFRNDPVPQVSMQTIEGRGPTETVKLTLTQGSDTITMELPENEERGLKINGIAFSTEEILGNENSAQNKMISIPYFRNAALKKKNELLKASIVPTLEQFKAMKPLDWAQYQAKIGELLAKSEEVTNAFAGDQAASINRSEKKYADFLMIFIGDLAFAAPKLRGACVVAGWGTTYHPEQGKEKSRTLKRNGSKLMEDNYCSKDYIPKHLDIPSKAIYEESKRTCDLTPGAMPCAPFFRKADGNPICVQVGRDRVLLHATQKCYEIAREQNGGIIAGILKSGGLGLTADGKIAAEDIEKFKNMLVPIDANVLAAIKACSENRDNDPGQKTACDSLEAFKIDLETQKNQLLTSATPAVVAPAVVAPAVVAPAVVATAVVAPAVVAPAVAATSGDNACFGLIKSDLVCGGLLGATGASFIAGLIGYNKGKKAGYKKGKKKAKVIHIKGETKVETKIERVNVPGPTVTVTVPGPTVIKEVIKEVKVPVKTENNPTGQPPVGGVLPPAK
jgi:hypothetical protein